MTTEEITKKIILLKKILKKIEFKEEMIKNIEESIKGFGGYYFPGLAKNWNEEIPIYSHQIHILKKIFNYIASNLQI